jgi:flagellar hook-length control protein FliK
MSANLTAATNPGAATTPGAATKPGTTTSPQRPASEARSTRTADDHFDRRLDAARQQHDNEATAKRREETPSQPEPAAPVPVRAGDAGIPVKAAAQVATDDTESTEADAAALAAMLALLGQTVLGAPAAAATAAAAGNRQGPMLPATAQSVSATGRLPAAAGPGLAATGDGAAATTSDTVATVPDTALSALVAGARATQEDHASFPDLVAQAAFAVAPGLHDAGNLPAAPHVLSIASPLGTPAFGSELGRQVTWLGMQDIKQARIRLHPQELGSLDVHVTVNHNRVDVTFAVQHPAAVHAVQQSLAQLDSMLAQHGLSLGQADVGQRQQGAPRGEAAGGIAGVDAPDEGGASVRPLASTALPGLLDTFA